tara:strand:+ start:44793 stop:45539 length:747 start_codon:yes stop_codon:yes gene_type:complete
MSRNEELELQIDLRRSLRAWRYYRDEKEDSYNLLKMYNDDIRGALEILLRRCKEATSSSPPEEHEGIPESQEKPHCPPTTHEAETESSESEEKELADSMEEFPKWMKQLYRDIAVKTHPDKLLYTSGSMQHPLSEEEVTQRFVDAKSFYKEKNTAALLDMAVDLDIELNRFEASETQGVIDYIRQNTEELRLEIMNAQHTTLWIWGRAKGDRELMASALKTHALSLKIAGVTQDIVDQTLAEYLGDEE